MDKYEVFGEFKFNIGDLVRHRTNRKNITWVVVHKSLVQSSSGGITKWYGLINMALDGSVAFNQCLEIELEGVEYGN